jgi:hypothetical protein
MRWLLGSRPRTNKPSKTLEGMRGCAVVRGVLCTNRLGLSMGHLPRLGVQPFSQLIMLQQAISKVG